MVKGCSGQMGTATLGTDLCDVFCADKAIIVKVENGKCHCNVRDTVSLSGM